MTRSTPRTGLFKAAALLFALALGSGWAQLGPVLAYSTVEAGGHPAGAPVLADPLFQTAPGPDAAWLESLHDQREDLSAAAAQSVHKKPAAKVSDAKPKADAKPADAKPRRAREKAGSGD